MWCSESYLTAVGVPLSSMPTNLSTNASFGTRPCVTKPCEKANPMTGRIANLAKVTAKIAGMGSLLIGFGICMRANDAPRRISANGTLILPTSSAVHEQSY